MSYLHKFGPDDLFYTSVETHPEYAVELYSGSAYINNRRFQGRNIPSGTISLYESNVDRASDLIYAYLVKDATYRSFWAINSSDYHSASIGETLVLPYPLSATVDQEYIEEVDAVDGNDIQNLTAAAADHYFARRKRILALRNTIESYRKYSNAFKYNRQNGSPNFMSGALSLVSIPSIMFDSGIKPGTVSLKFYYTGSLMDEAVDKYRNGELISTKGDTSGSTVGVVLYNQGFMILSSSQTIQLGASDNYRFDGVQRDANWTYFGAYKPTSSVDLSAPPSASLYSVSFKGTNTIPVRTMFATAKRGDLNSSQNPTWVSSSAMAWRDKTFFTASSYIEDPYTSIKNTIKSEYCNSTGSFEKQVFISEIGVFDEFKRLIAIAKLANPVLKKETDDYTFKLKLDF